MTRKVWTPEEAARLAIVYPDKSNWDLAVMFGTSRMSVNAKGQLMGLKKSAAFRKVCTSKAHGARYGVSLEDRMMDAIRAAGAAGLKALAAVEMFGNSRNTISTIANRMETRGAIFASAFQEDRAYFANKEDADAHGAAMKQRRDIRRATLHRLREERYRAEERALKPIVVKHPKTAKAAKPPKDANAVPKRSTSWPEEDLAKLRTDYPLMGVASVPWRKAKAVHCMANKLGVKCLAKNLGGIRKAANAKTAPKTPKAPKVRAKRERPGRALVAVAKAPAPPVKRGPAHLDVPITYSPNFRHVVYPSKPAPLRTNTHDSY